jgi:hypothetical protein
MLGSRFFSFCRRTRYPSWDFLSKSFFAIFAIFVATGNKIFTKEISRFPEMKSVLLAFFTGEQEDSIQK